MCKPSFQPCDTLIPSILHTSDYADFLIAKIYLAKGKFYFDRNMISKSFQLFNDAHTLLTNLTSSKSQALSNLSFWLADAKLRLAFASFQSNSYDEKLLSDAIEYFSTLKHSNSTAEVLKFAEAICIKGRINVFLNKGGYDQVELLHKSIKYCSKCSLEPHDRFIIRAQRYILMAYNTRDVEFKNWNYYNNFFKKGILNSQVIYATCEYILIHIRNAPESFVSEFSKNLNLLNHKLHNTISTWIHCISLF